ncbi:hypothetical protein B0T20DRAFT_416868 [Sordaria brevicollis]|uniref:Uncharacterized protein n=1 Tax=Sordaria brevicollis TaxID=83679 RepID=A0AAE0U9P7_SORBR|nr:hypothetical protein B0T20DRAFT_416868 [Sordaria brevicollis]
MKRHLEKYDLTKSGPNRQQQVGNHTSGPSKNTETGGNGADRNSYNHGTSQQRERDDRTRRSSWSTRDRNQDTWTDTNGERRDHRINRRERTPTAAARSRSDSPKLSNSPDTSGVSTSTNSPSNTTILACLPPNTPVEVLRCLERYHQNIADDLRLERRSMSRNRTTRSLYDPDGADKRDNDDQGQRGRSDAGPCSSILDCLNSTGSHLDMMRQLGLHYQFQADELRLECLRIEKEERRRERRARRHRERD